MKERRREEKNSKTVQKSDSKREGKLGGGERQRERERSIAGERVIEEKELTREFL